MSSISQFIMNFFNNRGVVSTALLLSEFFDVNYDILLNELGSYSKQEYDILNFIKKFNLDMLYKYKEETYISCRHATTTYDNLMFMKSNGLLNLRQMIESESPLNAFLERNKISFDIVNKLIFYNGNQYKILDSEELCEECIFPDYDCTSLFRNNLPDYKSCNYRERLDLLENKIYHDKCETEVFIDGTIKDIYKYNNVRYSPEILHTLENITLYYDKKIGNLVNQWRDIPNNKYYILEFDVEINNFEFISTSKAFEINSEIRGILEYFDYNEIDFLENNLNPIFYQNLFVLRCLINNSIWGSGERYGQLFPSTIIPYEDIRIIREHDINFRALEEQ